MPEFWKTPAKPTQLRKLHTVTVSHHLKPICPRSTRKISLLNSVSVSQLHLIYLHLIQRPPTAGKSNPGKRASWRLAAWTRQGQRIWKTALCLTKLTTALPSVKQVPTSQKESRTSRFHRQEWPLELRSGGGSVPAPAVLFEAV